MSIPKKLAQAFKAAIPGFDIPPPRKKFPKDFDEVFYWFDEWLGKDFICYVEWKDFSSWGFKGVNDLLPIRQAGVQLSLSFVDDKDLSAYAIPPSEESEPSSQAEPPASSANWIEELGQELRKLQSARSKKPASGEGDDDDENEFEDDLFDVDLNDPAEYYLPPLNEQLAPHKLQLVQLDVRENPRLLCISTDETAFGDLFDLLYEMNLELVLYPPKSADA
jgi:hypothetical protein